MAKQSTRILVYRFRDEVLEVLLIHPGGALWAKKDAAAWSIPTGIGYMDSFDRMLVAQAQIESIGIISNDQKLRKYDVDILW